MTARTRPNVDDEWILGEHSGLHRPQPRFDLSIRSTMGRRRPTARANLRGLRSSLTHDQLNCTQVLHTKCPSPKRAYTRSNGHRTHGKRCPRKAIGPTLKRDEFFMVWRNPEPILCAHCDNKGLRSSTRNTACTTGAGNIGYQPASTGSRWAPIPGSTIHSNGPSNPENIGNMSVLGDS